MSTKALRESLKTLRETSSALPTRRSAADAEAAYATAIAEVEAIEKAAKSLAEESIGDFVYTVRDRHGDWMHPKVTAYSEASSLVDAIAKESP